MEIPLPLRGPMPWEGSYPPPPPDPIGVQYPPWGWRHGSSKHNQVCEMEVLHLHGTPLLRGSDRQNP